MKINILLPYKEKFDENKASSVSITVKNNLNHSTTIQVDAVSTIALHHLPLGNIDPLKPKIDWNDQNAPNERIHEPSHSHSPMLAP